MLQMEVGDISSSQAFHWKTKVLSQMKLKKKRNHQTGFPYFRVGPANLLSASNSLQLCLIAQ